LQLYNQRPGLLFLFAVHVAFVVVAFVVVCFFVISLMFFCRFVFVFWGVCVGGGFEQKQKLCSNVQPPNPHG